MSKNFMRIIFWSGAVLTAILIFIFSSQISSESAHVSDSVTAVLASVFVKGYKQMTELAQYQIIKSINGYVRKMAHFSIYTVLSIFISLSLSTYARFKSRYWACSVLISMLYAITDELHQYFVPGRACQLKDVIIDTCGALLGAVFVILLLKIHNKILLILSSKSKE